MSKGLYIGGTGFACGKSLVASVLSRSLLLNGKKLGFLNCVETGTRGRAYSISLLRWIAGGQLGNLEYFSAYALRKNSSPHLAFELAEQKFELDKILKKYIQFEEKHDFVIVDGVGATLTPITRFYTSADLVNDLAIPVLLVTQNTKEAIQRIEAVSL